MSEQPLQQRPRRGQPTQQPERSEEQDVSSELGLDDELEEDREEDLDQGPRTQGLKLDDEEDLVPQQGQQVKEQVTGVPGPGPTTKVSGLDEIDENVSQPEMLGQDVFGPKTQVKEPEMTVAIPERQKKGPDQQIGTETLEVSPSVDPPKKDKDKDQEPEQEQDTPKQGRPRANARAGQNPPKLEGPESPEGLEKKDGKKKEPEKGQEKKPGLAKRMRQGYQRGKKRIKDVYKREKENYKKHKVPYEVSGGNARNVDFESLMAANAARIDKYMDARKAKRKELKGEGKEKKAWESRRKGKTGQEQEQEQGQKREQPLAVKGPEMEKGPKGPEKGQTGPKGPEMEKGPRGPEKGQTGPKGPEMEKGPKGPEKGQTGPKGPEMKQSEPKHDATYQDEHDKEHERSEKQRMEQSEMGKWQEMEPNAFYERLGVEPDTDEQGIKKAFRKGVLKHHPDKQVGKSQEEQDKAKEQFQQLSEAFEVLGNKDRRGRYDGIVKTQLEQQKQREQSQGRKFGGYKEKQPQEQGMGGRDR
jgi:hypothetical protein